MKRRSRYALLLSTLLLVTACTGPDGAARRFGSLGTGGTGGIYYPLGGVIARMLSERLDSMTFTAEVTGGSVENLNRVASGEMDLGIAIGTTLALAASGPDAARYEHLRIVAPLYPNVAHLLVARNADIESLAQIEGRRLSVGSAGSGTEQMSRELLSAYGLTLDDVDVRYLSFAESSAALRDGAIDAAILSVGYPASAVLEATTAGGVQLIGIEPQRLDTLIAQYAYYSPTTLPANAYPGVTTDLTTAAVRNWIFATADLAPEIVIALLDSLSDGREQLEQVNQIASQIDLGALDRAPLELHPAAVAWRGQAGFESR